MKYRVLELHMSPVDVMDALCDGLSEMKAGVGDSRFQGMIGLVLSIDDAFAESVEEAARRQGVKLEQVEA